jgi:uncharacterized membrane protein YidH (DUF202 family)
MQLTRMTTRRLMLVVLVVAALLTVFEAGRRWERAEKAVTHSTAAPHPTVVPSVETQFPWSSPATRGPNSK